MSLHIGSSFAITSAVLVAWEKTRIVNIMGASLSQYLQIIRWVLRSARINNPTSDPYWVLHWFQQPTRFWTILYTTNLGVGQGGIEYSCKHRIGFAKVFDCICQHVLKTRVYCLENEENILHILLYIVNRTASTWTNVVLHNVRNIPRRKLKLREKYDGSIPGRRRVQQYIAKFHPPPMLLLALTNSPIRSPSDEL